MKKVGYAVLLAICVSSPVGAAHCPHGQIYRVHLEECVSATSRLATAYVGRPLHLPLRKIRPLITLPVKPIHPLFIVPNADPTHSDTVHMLKAQEMPVPKF